jgi:hypothetical protein
MANVAVLAYHTCGFSDPPRFFEDLYFSNSQIREYGLGFWGISKEE